ncbi:hypothetical protein SESBI_23912 [Sesbania bispinosa]|nr:hypothetical protein SESBI_23912 [Sesbania bispinosa]
MPTRLSLRLLQLQDCDYNYEITTNLGSKGGTDFGNPGISINKEKEKKLHKARAAARAHCPRNRVKARLPLLSLKERACKCTAKRERAVGKAKADSEQDVAGRPVGNTVQQTAQ